MQVSVPLWLRMARVALTPRGWLLKTTLSNGAVVYGENRPGYGGRGAYIYRDALEPELQHLDRFLDAEGVLVDVGASTGIYSMKAAKHVGPHGIVVAIEPFPAVLAILQRSVQANGFAQVRLRNFCVAERTGVRTLWRNYRKPNSFSLIRRDPDALPFSVAGVTLDDLLAWEGLHRLDYLKIDVEGAEEAVLTGARGVIEKHRPIVQVEVSVAAPGIEQLRDYTVFHAPESLNSVCIPNGHAKMGVPAQLGWTEVAR